jgi:4-amino-4-deoxy-L-arabinose transferase-like glycosyltransferase
MALGLLVWMAAFVVVGYVVRLLRTANGAELATAPEMFRDGLSEAKTPEAIRLLQALPLVVLAALIWTEMRNRPLDDGHGDIAALWLFSMAYAIVVVAWPIRRLSMARFVAWLRAYQLEIGAVTILSLGALVLRAYALDRYPWIYSGDEGTFGLLARKVLDGQLKNPFGTAAQAHPNLWFYLQAGVMRVFGDNVAGSRMISVLFGVATIPVVYLFVRRHFGALTAFAAAAFTVVFHFHIFMSRDAQNNISSPFFVILVLWLLDRVIDKWRPIDALLAGIAIGLSQYFYAANRILVPVAVVYLGYEILAARPRTSEERSIVGHHVVKSGALIVAGFVLAFLPLGAYYYDHRETYTARFDIVSVFGSGWLDREVEFRGQSASWSLWSQFRHAAMAPFNHSFIGFYRVEFFDWPLGIATVIGLVVVTLGFWQRRYLGIAVAYWATIAGLALTEGLPQTNRFAAVGSLLPIIGAIGLVWITRYILSRARAPMFVMWTVVALVIGVTAAWNIRVYFKYTDAEPVARHSDVNTLIANTLAYELKDLGPGYTVYYAGAPRVYYNGHPNLPFIARGDIGIDVVEPWIQYAPPPVLTGPTIFFFTPERRAELAVVQQWFPDGEVIDHTMDDGSPLFTEYRVVPFTAASVF